MSRWRAVFRFAFLFFGCGFLVSLGGSVRGAEWLTLRNCHYLPNRANDGDSFHVRAGNKEYIFRLYFVDAPETNARIRNRVREQARYFHVTISQALQVGREAERFTRQALAGTFVVRTCLQDARGRSHLRRYFAFVETSGGDLGEMLVGNGLARVFGAAAEAPGMQRPAIEWHKLDQLERKAKKKRLGAWAVTFEYLRLQTAAQPGVSPAAVESSVHRERLRQPGTRPSSNGKLDLNTATTEQLERVPGIGRILAQRIIDARPFGGAEDLQRVKGIKAKKYEEIRPYFE